ncbi:Peptidyl-tRNA hydrolase, mitochondrial [Linum perenne]
MLLLSAGTMSVASSNGHYAHKHLAPIVAVPFPSPPQPLPYPSRRRRDLFQSLIPAAVSILPLPPSAPSLPPLHLPSSSPKMLSRIPKRCFCTAATTKPWLFVGLGNPGEKFNRTRHNVGFEMIDAFAESQGIPMDSVQCKAMYGEGFIEEAPVLLAKPQTYMNLSGESVGPLAAYYKLPLNRVLVFHDDMDLPCGVLRLQPKGGHGSHNGLKNVIYHFRGNREFARLRIGIGRPPGQMDPKAFLLQRFNATAQQRIDAALPEGVAALKSILSKGLTETGRWFNQQQKYKHIRLQTLPT